MKAHGARKSKETVVHLSKPHLVAHLTPRLYLEGASPRQACPCGVSTCQNQPHKPLRWECYRDMAMESMCRPILWSAVQKFIQRNVPEFGTAEWEWNHRVVERVDNPDLLKRYVKALQERFRFGGTAVRSRLVFHGTSAQAARSIVRNGFDEKHRRRSSLGEGDYFSLGVDSALDFAIQAQERSRCQGDSNPEQESSPKKCRQQVLLVCEVIVSSRSSTRLRGDYLVCKREAWELPRAIIRLRV